MSVTVIIPFKEDRGWLKYAVNSVPLEVQLIIAKGNGSWTANFNRALQQATGKYIKYLHEDDQLSANCIEESVRFLEMYDVDFIHGNAIEIDIHGKTMSKYVPHIKQPSLENLLNLNVIHSATTMYKREVFTKVGLFSENPVYYSFEEFEFNLRCLKAGLKIGYVDEVLAFYRRHPNQAIKTVNKQERIKNRTELVNSYL